MIARWSDGLEIGENLARSKSKQPPVAPKIIAFYLPQFHPTEENDRWWGPGFTEWHNVAKARPLFRGHMQPKLPGELGFYDLRLAQTRSDQAALAKQYGIHGFCYWHYWFGGKRLLETPIEEALEMNEPDLPFCLGWANESWTGAWHGSPHKTLIEQTYPQKDPERHYQVLRRFFRDRRYIKHESKPLLYVYKPRDNPRGKRYLQPCANWLAPMAFRGSTLSANGRQIPKDVLTRQPNSDWMPR
jgi:lipopolysaccharide biosynthesis protein